MACMTLFVQPMAMATTQLARVIHYQDGFEKLEGNLERNSLRTSWVVVTDGDGCQRLQMQWAPSADLR
jgi:hypothetical protein